MQRQNKIGWFGYTPEKRKEVALLGGYKAMEMGVGIHALTTEQRREIGKKSGDSLVKNKLGVHGMTHEQHVQAGKNSYRSNKKYFTSEQLSKNGKKGAHKYWHIIKGKINPECELCQKENLVN